MPGFFGRLIHLLTTNGINIPKAIADTRTHIDRHLATGKATKEVAEKFHRELDWTEATYNGLKDRDFKNPEVKKLRDNLVRTLSEIKKEFDEESSEAMKVLANQPQVGDFPESSAPSAGSSHQSQHYGSRYDLSQPSSHPVSQQTNRHEQKNPTFGQYETRHNLHHLPSLQRSSFEESHMQEQARPPLSLDMHIASQQQLREWGMQWEQEHLQKSGKVQSQSSHVKPAQSNQSGRRGEYNTADGRNDPLQSFPYGHRTRDSVNTFGIPHQASRIDPTASSTGHAGQSTESFSSSRTPSSNYTYEGRQSDGSSSRPGSTRSRRSQNPSSSGRGGGHYNLGPVPQTSYPAQSANYPSQPGPSQMQVPPSPYYPQPGPSSSTSGPSGYPSYPAYPQGPTQAGPFVPDDDEDLYDPGYSMPKAGPPPGQGRGRRGGHR